MRFKIIGVGCALMAFAPLAAAEKPYSPARDAYGHPVLEGNWSGRWLTNLERPAGVPLALDAEGAVALTRQIMADRGKADLFDPEIADPDAHSLAMVRGQYRSSLIVEPDDGRVPLTEAGRAALAALPRATADGPESRSPGERCLIGGRAPMLIIPAAMIKAIIQTRDHVAIYSEGADPIRILDTSGAAQAVDFEDWSGQSRARWQGDSLVVETSGFRPDDKVRSAPFSRFPIRPQTRITERFTRISAAELLYEFTVEDPVLFTRPWRAEYAYALTEDRIFEFACHEGNYGLANILSGARDEERRAASATGAEP